LGGWFVEHVGFPVAEKGRRGRISAIAFSTKNWSPVLIQSEPNRLWPKRYALQGSWQAAFGPSQAAKCRAARNPARRLLYLLC
jgi:hypothetical protein